MGDQLVAPSQVVACVPPRSHPLWDLCRALLGASVMEWGDAKAKQAAAQHDTFNAVFIPPIVLLTFVSLYQQYEAQAPVHWMLVYATMAYVLMDIVYHFFVPKCQPDPVRLGTIMFHHFITAWLLVFPIMCPDSGSFVSYCTVVEINTLCQVLKKLTKMPIFDKGFLFTWFSMRLILYPWLIWRFHKLMMDLNEPVGGYRYFQVVGSQIVLVGLNVFWTVEFLSAMAKKKKS